MTDGSSADFSSDQRRALACVLDALIPPSADGRMPGAGTAGVGAHVERVLHTLPELRAMVVEGLRDLDVQARTQHERSFVELGDGERAALVAMQGFSYALVPHTYIGYYQQERILEAIGVEPRPPHPKGYTMPENDLTLLAPVRSRGKEWRRC